MAADRSGCFSASSAVFFGFNWFSMLVRRVTLRFTRSEEGGEEEEEEEEEGGDMVGG